MSRDFQVQLLPATTRVSRFRCTHHHPTGVHSVIREQGEIASRTDRSLNQSGQILQGRSLIYLSLFGDRGRELTIRGWRRIFPSAPDVGSCRDPPLLRVRD